MRRFLTCFLNWFLQLKRGLQQANLRSHAGKKLYRDVFRLCVSTGSTFLLMHLIFPTGVGEFLRHKFSSFPTVGAYFISFNLSHSSQHLVHSLPWICYHFQIYIRGYLHSVTTILTGLKKAVQLLENALELGQQTIRSAARLPAIMNQKF